MATVAPHLPPHCRIPLGGYSSFTSITPLDMMPRDSYFHSYHPIEAVLWVASSTSPNYSRILLGSIHIYCIITGFLQVALHLPNLYRILLSRSTSTLGHMTVDLQRNPVGSCLLLTLSSLRLKSLQHRTTLLCTAE